MTRNLRLIKELIKLRFHNLMMFKLGFFGPFFVDGSLFIIQLLVFQAIYANVDRIGTWEKGEMIIFIGTFSLINALNMVIFFFGILSIPDKIKSGELDLYLTKPMNPLLRLTFEKVNPGSIPLLILSLVIIIYGAKISELTITFLGIIQYLLWIIVMALLYYDMEVIIRTFSFFVISTTNINKLEEEGIGLCMKLPGVVFKGVYKLLFYVILPYGIIATFPTLSLTNEISKRSAIFGLLIVVGFTVFTKYFWKTGLKHYNSASS